MGCDKGQLKSAGEKAEHEHHIAFVIESFDKRLFDGLAWTCRRCFFEMSGRERQ